MKRILIIEDSQETLNALREEFENSGYETVCCSDFEAVQKKLENNHPFDAVILDWFFVLPDSSEYSKTILGKIKEKFFVPVFVYTGHLTDFNEQTEEDLGYPRNMLIGFDKTISTNELNEKINQLTESILTYKLAITYREKLKSHLEKVFFELNDSENSTLGKILKTIYGDGDNIDWNNDIIITLLHRSLVSDDSFTSSIAQLLRTTNENINNSDFNKKIINKIMYHHGKSDFIRNGDIVIIKSTDSLVKGYGIVVTPDCDLENATCRQIEVVEIRAMDDNKMGLNNESKKQIKDYKHLSLFYLPSIIVDNELKDFVVVFKHKHLFHEKDVADGTKFPKASKRLLYSQQFTLNDSDANIEFLCSLVNPYKEEFLQKLHNNNSRVGIPDIKNLL